jgi:hypothetical protein
MAEHDVSARLVALVAAGRYRLALPAELVREVGQVQPGDDLVSLLEVLGEPSVVRPAWSLTLVLPEGPRRFGIDGVESVRPLATAAFYNLPLGLGLEPVSLLRGALKLDDGLALELRPEALSTLGPPRAREAMPMGWVDEPAPRALICTLAGRSVGFPLTQVLSVLARPRLTPVPRASPGVCGVIEHAQTLYGAVDPGGIFFGRPSTGDFGVLVEQGDRTWLILADAVGGVRQGFRPVAGGEPGWMQGERGERALFMRLRGA